MRRDNFTDSSLWTERVSFAESCTSGLAAVVECQKFGKPLFSICYHYLKVEITLYTVFDSNLIDRHPMKIFGLEYICSRLGNFKNF